MREQFALADGRGCLNVQEDGARAVLEGFLPEDRRGLYKGYLTGRQGRVLLGTFLPEGGRLCLRRTIPLAELKRQGAWPPSGAEAVLSFPARQRNPAQQKNRQTQPPTARCPDGWAREPNPARLMGDPPLSRACTGTEGAVVQRIPRTGGFALGFPWRQEQPFPLALIFCFAQIRQLEGREYLVFVFDGRGWPVPPEEG